MTTTFPLLDEQENPIEGHTHYLEVDEAFRQAKRLDRKVIVSKQEGEGKPVPMGYVGPGGWSGPKLRQRRSPNNYGRKPTP